MPPFALSKILEFIGIRGGIAIGFAVLLGIVMWRADTISGQRDEANRKYIASETRHAVTRASLATLEGKLAEFVEAGELRAESRDKALEEVKAEVEALRKSAEDFDITTAEGL